MPRHRLYIIDDPAALHEGAVVIGGEEARHAIRVKRLEKGEPVEVLDGAGRVGVGVFTDSKRVEDGWQATVTVETIRREPALRPRLTVCAAAPKGNRLDEMIDGLSQSGVAQWRPLTTARSGPVPATDGRKGERLRRIAAEASKQCGRAWLLEIGEPLAFAEALRAEAGQAVVLAHADAEAHAGTGTPAVRLLIGPEGGWSPEELEAARASGVRAARFGPHTMRVETAAVVAAAVILHTHRHTDSG